jgi:hypothetical protein
MSEIKIHQGNLAYIENHIAELKIRIESLWKRLRILEAKKLNTEPTSDLLAILIEHLEVMEFRRQLAISDIRVGQTIGKT